MNGEETARTVPPLTPFFPLHTFFTTFQLDTNPYPCYIMGRKRGTFGKNYPEPSREPGTRAEPTHLSAHPEPATGTRATRLADQAARSVVATLRRGTRDPRGERGAGIGRRWLARLVPVRRGNHSGIWSLTFS